MTYKRGLANASPETRQRIAKKGGNSLHRNGRGLQKVDHEKLKEIAIAGGKARAKDKAGLSAAGKRGGNRVLQTKGKQFYREIGARGGDSTKRNHLNTDYYREIGKSGGRKVANTFGLDYFENISRMGKKKKRKRRTNSISSQLTTIT